MLMRAELRRLQRHVNKDPSPERRQRMHERMVQIQAALGEGRGGDGDGDVLSPTSCVDA